MKKLFFLGAAVVMSSFAFAQQSLATKAESDSREVVVNNNVAGNLESQISESEKLTAQKWIISGELNSSDMKFLRDVFEFGVITDLDLGNAQIVSGGEPYYSQYYTQDNVIGTQMFTNAKSLVSLIMPSSTVTIEDFSFRNCDNLIKLDIPDQCETIEDNAIEFCDLLTVINIGKSLNYYGIGNGNYCPLLAEITVDAQNENFESVDGVLYNKDLTSLYKYPEAKENPEYTVPSSVTFIDGYAFARAKFERIFLPTTLTSIQTGTFNYCLNLINIEIPRNVETIGLFAFQHCESLVTISVPDKVEELKDFCFGYCYGLRTCNLGSGLKDIDDTAFTGDTSLEYFSVSDQNPYYTASEGILYSKDMSRVVRCPLAFSSEVLSLSDDIEIIDSYAFESCTGIAGFNLPSNLKEIGNSAFKNCIMENIEIPNSVEKIGMAAFEDCDNLVSFAIPESLGNISYNILYGCNELNYLYIPKGIQGINTYAFARCKNLTTIECCIEDFSDIDIPVNFSGQYTQFDGIAEDCTWHVPNGLAEEYKSQPWWIPTWKIVDDIAGVNAIEQESNLVIYGKEGAMVIETGVDTTIVIYSISGMLVNKINAKAGIALNVQLPRGVYIVNGKKVLV